MKIRASFFLLTLSVLLGCKVQQTADTPESNEVFKKKGVALFSPILNATYFFPFKNNRTEVYSLKDFMKHEYDTGFIISWYQSKWRDEILNHHSMTISDDNTYKDVAYVALEYYPLKTFPRDSIYSFEFEYSGIKKNFIYDDKPRKFKDIKGLKE